MAQSSLKIRVPERTTQGPSIPICGYGCFRFLLFDLLQEFLGIGTARLFGPCSFPPYGFDSELEEL